MSEPQEFLEINDDVFVLLDDIENDDNFKRLLSESESSGFVSNLQQPRLDATKIKVVFFIGDRGCIPIDEYVYTPNGICEIKDVYDGMPILGGYVKNPVFFEDDVYELSIMGTKYRLTGEHPLWLIKNKERVSFYKDKKYVIEQKPFWCTVKELFNHYQDKKSADSRWHVYRYDSTQFAIKTISIGKKFAKLLGYLMSDGSFSELQSVKFTNVRKSLMDDVVQLSLDLSEEFEISTKYYKKGNGGDLLLTGKYGRNYSILKDKLRELGVINRDTLGKIVLLQEDELIEFLKGYFNGDGNLYFNKKPNSKSVSRQHPYFTFYTGISRKQTYELQYILWRLGVKNSIISHRIRQSSTKNGEKYKVKNPSGCWEIEIGKRKAVSRLMDILEDRKYPDKFIDARKKLSEMKNTSDHQTDDSGDWVPVYKIEKIGRRKVCGWKTIPSSEIILYNGLKTHNSGKTTAIEEDAEAYYLEHITPLYIWGSRSNENVFTGVNLYCKHRWDKEKDLIQQKSFFARTREERAKFEQQLEQLESRLHCNCNKPYPINWLVPSYWDFEGVDNYNTCWSGKEEYEIALENQWITKPYHELTLKQRDLLSQRKLKKPKYLVKTDLIRICPFTIPIGAKDKEEFEKQFLQYLFEARDEHRWLVMNPLMFLDEKEKFATIGYIFERLKFWMDTYFQPLTPQSVAKMRNQKEPVPKSEWTKKELSYDKICLILPEIRTIAPPQRFSPEKQSTLAKRPLVDMVPELRHFRIYLLGDLQAYDDLNDSVRPMADYVIVKRATRELLGQEWSNFVTKIEQLRKDRLIAISHGKFDDFKKAPSELKQIIDKDLPNIPEIPKNRGYVVYRNGEFFLEQFNMSAFHHKSETQTIQSATGITWKLNLDKASKTSSNEGESGAKSKKRLKDYDNDIVMKFLTKSFIINKSWEIAQQNYVNLMNEGKMPSTNMATMPTKSISTKIRRVPELLEVIEFAKKHPEKSIDELTKSLS